MRSFTGQELAIGDVVVYAHTSYRRAGLVLVKITKLGKGGFTGHRVYLPVDGIVPLKPINRRYNCPEKALIIPISLREELGIS